MNVVGSGPVWQQEANDPKTIDDWNVDGEAFRSVTSDWDLEVLPGTPHY